jgi:hypothetical protein
VSSEEQRNRKRRIWEKVVRGRRRGEEQMKKNWTDETLQHERPCPG